MGWHFDLVDTIYEELASAGTFQSGMSLVAHRFKAAHGIVQLHHRDTAEVRALGHHRVSDAMYADYSRVSSLDPWVMYIRRSKADSLGCVLSHEVVPDRELRRTEFYHEFWKPYGLSYSFGALLPMGSEWLLYMGFPRLEHQAPYGEDELEEFRFPMRHLWNAALLRERVSDPGDRAVLRELMFDRLNFAAVLLEGNGRVLDLNERARELIGPRGALRVTHGRLAAGSPEARDALASALANLSAAKPEPSPPFEIGEPGTERRWMAYLWPLVADGGSAYCLILLEPERVADDGCRLMARRFRLTTAEEAVLRELTLGQSLNGIAESRSVSLSTVRSQLKSLLSKTGCHSQAQLVAVCARFAPPLR